VGKIGDTTLKRKEIQKKVYASQVFNSYKSANDQEKEKYYFSHDLNCKNNGEKIDTDSLFCHTVGVLNAKQDSDYLTNLNYDLHIILVGTTLQPLMLSVSAINATNILLIYDDSHEGENKKDDLYDYIKVYKSIEAKHKAINSSEPHTVFSSIKEIIGKSEWNKKRICIDITGGKKSMVGGGFLASSILGIDTYYIDFEKYENGHPVLCTEFLNKLDNPYHIYNIQLLNQAKELFKNHDYAGANKLFKSALKKLDENIVKKYSLKQERQKIENMQKAAECYMYWDRFEYQKIENSLLTNAQKELLQENDYYLSIDYLLNAQRRYNQANYNDGIVRLAQVVEFLLIDENSSEDMSIAINNKIADNTLKSDLHKLRKSRNKFIHRNENIEKTNFEKSVNTIKNLISIRLNKQLVKITNDLKEYAFSTEFNDDGTLKAI